MKKHIAVLLLLSMFPVCFSIADYLNPKANYDIQVSTSNRVAVSVRKGSSGMIPRGAPVSFAGYSSASTGGYYTVEPSDADNAAIGPAAGIADENISASSPGLCITAGLVTNIDTSSFSVGDILYVSTTAGSLSATATAGAQPLAVVVRKDSKYGVLKVGGLGNNSVANTDPVQTSYPTYYIDSVSGSDSNSGLSPAKAWKTIAKVNAATFSAGNSILFKRGCTWREQLIPPSSGSAGSPITFGAYGNGPRPKLLLSSDLSATGSWTDATGNMWYASASVDVGNLIFSNESSCGVKFANSTGVDAAGEFYYRPGNSRLYLYSASNPGGIYRNIEAALNNTAGPGYYGIVRISAKNYITIQDIDFRYSGNHGIQIKNNSGNIIIQNCEFSYIGGGYNPSPTRYGNGVEVWESGHDITVRNCKFDNIYDAAVTNQGTTAGSTQSNITYTNNRISNCEYSFEFWLRDATSSASNIRFEHNTCSYAGGGWGHSQRADPTGYHFCFFSSTAALSNIFLRYNILHEAETNCLWLTSNTFTDLANMTLDYNNYWQADGNVVSYAGTSYTLSNFTTYQSVKGKDAASTVANSTPQIAGAAIYHEREE